MVFGFDGFRAIGGTTISLDIGYVATIAALKNTTTRNRTQANFDAAVLQYIASAQSAGLQVEALAGDAVWIQPTKRSATVFLMDYVAAFNTNAPTMKFTGLQFDLEPWVLPTWAHSPVAPTTQWLDTVAALAAKQAATAASNRTPLTFVVPFWLDGSAAPKTLSYGGISASPTAHIIRMLDNGAGQSNAVSVMAYRDFVAGSNGSAALSATEMTLADATNGRVNAIIAQEASNVERAKITFSQEGRSAMVGAMIELHAAYGTRPSFGGFAVNDFRSLVLLA